MKRDDWMLLILTFLTGLAIGMYVYIMAFKPTYIPDKINSTEVEAGDWSMISKKRIEGDQSRNVQPSFRLLANGKYTYIHGGVGDGALDAVEGKISGTLISKIRENDSAISRYAVIDDTARCYGDDEGYEYEYNITIDNESYFLDTCHTALKHNTALAQLLDQVWQEIEGKQGKKSNNPSLGSYDTPADWLQAWLRRNLGARD